MFSYIFFFLGAHGNKEQITKQHKQDWYVGPWFNLFQPCLHSCLVVFSAVIRLCWTFQVVLVVKNLPANAGDIRDMGSIPRLGRPPGEGHGNPLQYSCLENPMDRGARWAMVHEVTKSQTRLKQQEAHIGLCHFPTLKPFKGTYHL